MKKVMMVVGIVASLSIFVGGCAIMTVLGKGCNTATKMADQTVFNADKHVWTYEQFYAKYEAYKQYQSQYDSAKKSLESASEAEKDGLIMQKQGSFQMMTNIAAEYNKMSDVAYQKIWKDKNLPDKLEAPTP